MGQRQVRVLALDAATERCSVALRVGEAVTARAQDGVKSSAAEILRMIEALLAEAGIELAALDAIVASVGPGAFTGVRVSVAVAQGLAFGAGLPVVPVMTLESLAFRAIRGCSQAQAPRVLACLDARMGELYWGCFECDPVRGVRGTSPPRVSPPEAVMPDAPGRWRGVGKGLAAYPGVLARLGLELERGDAQALPEAADAALLGALRLEAGEGVDPAELSPVYLRDKVALTEAERRDK